MFSAISSSGVSLGEIRIKCETERGSPGDEAGLAQAFVAHNEAVKATIPAERLLVYEIKDGWEPLCAFLDVPTPTEAFPRTNDRSEFWDLVQGKG